MEKIDSLRWVSVLALAIAALPCRAAEPESIAPSALRLKAILGYHYSSGKYGTSERTQISYIPLTLRGELRDWTLSLTIPYIRIDGSSQQLIEAGNGPVLSTNAGGLGDLIGSLAYLFTPPRTWLPFLELRGRVKFPTASRNAGLGTGEFDYGVEAELSHVFGRITPYLGAGYRFLGDPPNFHLRNVWLASAGAVYDLSESVDTGLFLYFRQASSRATDAQLELFPYIECKLTEHWSTSGYLSAGILEGSPDVGVGLQFAYRY